MNAPAQPIPTQDTAFWQEFAARVVMAGVKAKGISDGERKERIMLARQCGFLSDEAAEDMIVLWGLAGA